MTTNYNIHRFFRRKIWLIKRGENLLNASNLMSYNQDPTGVIQARVHASWKNKVYDVKITLNDDKSIKTAYCSCPAGKNRCAHHSAVLQHSLKVSRTDLPCEWSRQKKPDKVSSLEELFGIRDFNPLNRQPDDNDADWMKSNITESCDFFHFLNNEFNDENTLDFSQYLFDEILKESKEVSGNKVNFILDKLKVTDGEQKRIFEGTVGQSQNSWWLALRKGRFTASNFSAILSAVRLNRVPKSLVKTLMGEYQSNNSLYIQWGSTHEETALDIYSKVKGCTIEKGGLFLHETGVLACSPDGLLGDDKLIEVKCPYTQRNADSLLSVMASGKWYLTSKPNVSANYHLSDAIHVYEFSEGDVSLNLKHELGRKYYHQIQGNLHLLKREFCDLVVWTPSSITIVPICKDPSWENNLKLLIDFYSGVYIYYLRV